MGAMFAAQVWHYWIAVLLVPPIVLLTVAMVGMYLKKVQSPRYPRD
jgi:hypothetical protein